MSDSDSAWEEEEQGGDDHDDSESEEAYEGDEDDEEIVRGKKPQNKAAASSKKKPAAKTQQQLKQESAEEQSIKTEDASSCAVADDDNNDKPLISRRPKKRRRIVITQEEIEAESLIPSYARLTAAGGYVATAAHRKKIGMANAGKKPWNKGKQRSQADKDKIKAAVRERNQRQLLANLASVNMTEDEYKMYKKKIKLMRENVRKTKLLVKSKLETKRAMEENAKLLAEQEVEEEEEENQIIKEEEVDGINQVSVVDKAQKEEGVKEEEEAKIPAVAEQIPTTRTEQVQTTQEIEATTAITEAAPATTPTSVHDSVAAASAEESNNVPAAAASPSHNVSAEDENASLDALLEQRIKYSWTKVWVEASAAEVGQVVPVEQPGQGVTRQAIETLHEQPAIPNSDKNAGIVTTDRHPVMENDPAVATAVETTTTTTAVPAPAAPPPKQKQEAFEVETVPEIFRRDFEWSSHERFGFGEESFECPQGGPGGLICCAACTKAYADYLNVTFSDLQSQKINKVAAELETICNFMHGNQERLSKSVTAARRKPPPSSLGET